MNNNSQTKKVSLVQAVHLGAVKVETLILQNYLLMQRDISPDQVASGPVPSDAAALIVAGAPVVVEQCDLFAKDLISNIRCKTTRSAEFLMEYALWQEVSLYFSSLLFGVLEYDVNLPYGGTSSFPEGSFNRPGSAQRGRDLSARENASILGERLNALRVRLDELHQQWTTGPIWLSESPASAF